MRKQIILSKKKQDILYRKKNNKYPDPWSSISFLHPHTFFRVADLMAGANQDPAAPSPFSEEADWVNLHIHCLIQRPRRIRMGRDLRQASHLHLD